MIKSHLRLCCFSYQCGPVIPLKYSGVTLLLALHLQVFLPFLLILLFFSM